MYQMYVRTTAQFTPVKVFVVPDGIILFGALSCLMNAINTGIFDYIKKCMYGCIRISPEVVGSLVTTQNISLHSMRYPNLFLCGDHQKCNKHMKDDLYI